jgi:hypothetical protein
MRGPTAALLTAKPGTKAAAPSSIDLRLKGIIARSTELSICPAHDCHQFFYLAALLSLVVGVYRMLDAVTNVVLQDLLLQAAQSGPGRCNLGDDVDTVSIFLDHAREPAHLPLDPVQSLCGVHLAVPSHA